MVGLEGDSAIIILGGGHVLHGGAVIGNIVNHGILHAGGDGHGHDDLFTLVVAGQLDVVSHIVLQQVTHSSDQMAIGGSDIIGSDLADAGNSQFHGNIACRQTLFINRNIEGRSLTAIGNGNGLHAGGGHIGSGVLIAVFHCITLGVDLANEIFRASLGVHCVDQDVDHIKGIANQIIGCALVGNSDLGQFVTLGHIHIAVYEHAVVIRSKLQISKTAILLHQLISNGSQRVILAHRVQAQVLDGHKLIQLQIVSDDFALSVAGQFHIKSQEIPEDICKGRLILLVHVSSGHAGQTGSRCFHVVAIVADFSIVGDSVHADTNSDLQRSSGTLAALSVGIGQTIGTRSHKLVIDQVCAIFSGDGQLQIVHVQLFGGAIAISNHSLGGCLQSIANIILDHAGDSQSLRSDLGKVCKLKLNGHIVGVVTGIFAGRVVILENHSVSIQLHSGDNTPTLRILAVGIDITGIHVGKVGGNGRTTLDDHGFRTILLHIICVFIYSGFTGVVVCPEEDDIHLLSGSRNSGVPNVSAVVIISTLVQRLVRNDEDRLTGICTICPSSKGSSCDLGSGSSLHVSLSNGVDIVIVIRKCATGLAPIRRNVRAIFFIVSFCIGEHNTGQISQAVKHSSLRFGYGKCSITCKANGRCVHAQIDLAQNGLQIAFRSVNVRAEDRSIDGSFSFYTQDRCRQQAHDHDQSQQERQNSIHIFHTLSSLNLFKFSHYVRPVSPFGTKWVYFARL